MAVNSPVHEEGIIKCLSILDFLNKLLSLFQYLKVAVE